MTKELTQEVEEIVKQLAHQALALHLPGEVYDAYIRAYTLDLL